MPPHSRSWRLADAAVSRREFLARSAACRRRRPLLSRFAFVAEAEQPLFKISLAQWSLHRAFFGQKGVEKLDPLKFAEIAKKEYDIDAIEYVNQFYKDKKKDDAYLKDLKKVADDNGVRSVLIMCDGEGRSATPTRRSGSKAVENHYRWVEWAKFLGCHSIRVNAQTGGNGTARRRRRWPPTACASSPSSASKHEINVIVENHGGLSSNGEWLAGVMKMVDNKYCGTLPGLRQLRQLRPLQGRGRADAVRQGRLGQVARLRRQGRTRRTTDYHKMMEIVVKKHKYHGYVGIEYEGSKLSEPEGIKATKKLLETVRAELAKG